MLPGPQLCAANAKSDRRPDGAEQEPGDRTPYACVRQEAGQRTALAEPKGIRDDGSNPAYSGSIRHRSDMNP